MKTLLSCVPRTKFTIAAAALVLVLIPLVNHQAVSHQKIWGGVEPGVYFTDRLPAGVPEKTVAYPIPRVHFTWVDFMNDQALRDFLDTDDPAGRWNRIDEAYNGPVLLDWESQVALVYAGGSAAPAAAAELLRALKTCQAHRPNAKFGYFAIPLRVNSGSHPLIAAKNGPLEKVLESSDVLFPHAYRFYPYTNTNERDNIAQHMVWADLYYSKPMLPVISHRFAPNVQAVSTQLIPLSDFNADVQAFQSAGADGVVWFFTEQMLWDAQNPVIINDASQFASFDAFKLWVLQTYSSGMIELDQD